MTVSEVADLLRYHENWVYRRAAAGLLPSYKIDGGRRFRRDEIEAWLATHYAGPCQVGPARTA